MERQVSVGDGRPRVKLVRKPFNDTYPFSLGLIASDGSEFTVYSFSRQDWRNVIQAMSEMEEMP